MNRLLLLLCFFTFFIKKEGFNQNDVQKSVKNEPGIHKNPRDAQFYTQDINNFWRVFDQSYPKLSAKLFQTEYIDKGSSGLKGFLKNRIENGKLLRKTVHKKLDYYTFIRPYTLTIHEKKEKFYTCFENLKKLYPDAVFPDVYFVIGRDNTGGTIFDKGLIIGAERFGPQQGTFQPALDIEQLDEVVSHELIHFQQHYISDYSLLAQCIREGAADFIGELISGAPSTSAAMFAYGEANEAALWAEFLSKKDQRNWNNWLYYQKDQSRPSDLGYWMGYKICKAYYNKAADKAQAIIDILNIQDFNAFLEQSGYNGL